MLFRYRYDTETGLYYLNSRYYSPEWNRLVNADGILGQVGELQSHNIFAYCGNNPISRKDYNGFSWRMANEDIDTREIKLPKPLMLYKRLKENITKNSGTTTIGISEEHSFWLAGGFSIGISSDYQGNIALQFTPSIGAGGPNLSAGVFRTQTNAPNVDSLEGVGQAIGGSMGEGICLGGDFLVIPNSADGYYYGSTINASVGAKLPLPGEAHYLPVYTITLYQINVFDIIESLLSY